MKENLPNDGAAPSPSEIVLLKLLHSGKQIHEIADALGVKRTAIWTQLATLQNKGLLTQAMQLSEEGLNWV